MKTQKFLKAYITEQGTEDPKSCHKGRTIHFYVLIQFSHGQNCLRIGILCTPSLESRCFWNALYLFESHKKADPLHQSNVQIVGSRNVCWNAVSYYLYPCLSIANCMWEASAWRVYRLTCVSIQWRANKHVNKTRQILIVKFSTGSCLIYRLNLRLRE
jgi:hypothetical protein